MAFWETIKAAGEAKARDNAAVALQAEQKSLELSYLANAEQARYRSHDFDRAENYLENSWNRKTVSSAVWQCIAKLVLAYSTAPLALYKRGNDKPIESDPVLEVIRRPNEHMTEADIKGLLMLWRAIGGDSYEHKIMARDGTVLEKYPYHAGHIRPIPGKQKWIDFYLFMEGTSIEREIPPNEIIHYPWILRDPLEPWHGFAPLNMIARDLQIEEQVSRIIFSVLKNDAMVRGGLVDTKGTIVNQTQKDMFLQGFKDATTGENAGNIPLFTGGITYQRFGLNLQELDATGLYDVPEARIAGAFLEPLVYSGLTAGQQATTYDNLSGSRQFFYEDTINEFWKYDAERITNSLIARGDQRYFWFYTKDVVAFRKDVNAISARTVTEFREGIITRNEARAALERDPVAKELDGFYSDVAVAAVAPAKTPLDEPEAPDEQDTEEEPKTLPQGTRGRKDDDPEAKAVEYFKAYDTPAEQATQKIAGKLAGEFGKLLKVVLGKLPAKAYTKDDERLDPFDTPEWEAAFAKATTPDIRALILEQMARAVADAGENWADIYSAFDEAIDRTLDGSIDLIKTSVGTVKEELRDLLKANRTLPVSELRDLITRRFEEVYTKSRAQVIARTTSTYATGASQLEAWKELDTEYVWLTQRDGAVRDTHRAADGKRPGEDGKFTVGSATGLHPGAMSTAEESVNCRCVLRARPKK